MGSHKLKSRWWRLQNLYRKRHFVPRLLSHALNIPFCVKRPLWFLYLYIPNLLFFFMFTALTVDTIDSTNSEQLISSWITEPPESGVAVRNKPYTLQCLSSLPNVTYKWMFNNHTLDLVTDPRRQILSNGSLFFKTVSTSWPCLKSRIHGGGAIL